MPESKLAPYHYENKFSLGRNFAPSDQNPGEPKRRFRSGRKAARSTQPRAPGGFAHRLHDHVCSVFITTKRIFSAYNTYRLVLLSAAFILDNIRQYANRLYDKPYLRAG